MKPIVQKLWFLAFALLLALFFLSPDPVMTQNQPVKFGYVDVKRIFDNYGKVQTLSQDLRSTVERYDQKRIQLEDRIRTEQENFRMQRDLMGEEAVKQKQIEIATLERQLMQELADARKNLQALEDEGMEPIIQELNDVVQKFALEKGYDFILKKSNVAYIGEKYDLSNEIIALLNP